MLPLFHLRMPFFDGEPAAASPAPVVAPPPAAAVPAPVTPDAPPAATAAVPDRVGQLEKELAEARKEAAGYRTQNKGQLAELRKALAPLLGAEPGTDAPLDATQVLAQLTKRDQEREQKLRELQLSNALEQAGRKHGADMDLLVPHLRGSAALEKLDLTSEAFAKDVSEMVKGLLEKNPKLKATQVAARSGSEFPGGAPQVPQLTREQVAAMSKAGQHEQIEEARKKGQLDNLLHGRA